MQHLDLFSGIGGFALAARRVGWETIGFCETDEYCRQVIEKNFNSVRWVSLSGHIAGKSYRLGIERDTELPGISPDWLVIENNGQNWRKWVPQLRRRLWRNGYASLPVRVRASDCGAPHKRDRVYLIANAHGNSESLRAVYAEVARLCPATRFWRDWPDPMGMDDGLPPRMERLKGLGNAVAVPVAETIFRAIDEIERTP